MKKLLIIILLVLQAGFIFAQQPIGSYNPEQDLTAKNRTGTPQWMIEVAETLQSFFVKINPDGYTDGPFTNFFTFLASVFALFLLHLFYTKVLYKKPRYGKDFRNVIFRYKVFVIGFAVCLTLSMLRASFLWGVALAVVNLCVVIIFHAMFAGNLCPYCCCHGKIQTSEKPLGETCVEIYGLKTYSSQYLKPNEISSKSFPEGGYKVYEVRKYSYTKRCSECNNMWECERWKRIKEITL